MRNRPKIPKDVEADVVTAVRRRCCLCYGLDKDDAEQRGQIAHLDHDPGNNDPDNLAFLCLDHHDAYDTRTSQSKGLTMEEVKRYRADLWASLAISSPPSDAEIVAGLMEALDRPAFRTRFAHESSLPRFREAIAETIETINTGKTPQGKQISSKAQIRDLTLRARVDAVVQGLVALRASFDALVRRGAIRPCDCNNGACSSHMMSPEAIREMDARRRSLLDTAHSLNPSMSSHFYDVH